MSGLKAAGLRPKSMYKRCWQDKAQFFADEFGEFSDKALEAQQRPGTCLLPDGHSGPHEFTADDRITVSFRATAQSP